MPAFTVLLVGALLYDGWIFYQRHRDQRNAAQAAREREQQDARRVLDRLGGTGLAILAFYATPAVLRRGQSATLCYSVNGAAKVRLEPESGALRPALSHCLEVTPNHDTEYTLTAESADGRSTTARLVIRVKP